ncbi:hypothetical protein ACS0TY_034860 [Phlomoides rotata]
MAPKMMKSKVPMFLAEDYDDWKIRMQAHLSSMNDEIWPVIEDGPLVIMKSNTSNAQTAETVQIIPKPKNEWIEEDKRRNNLDNVAKNTIYHTLDKIVFSKIKQCKTAKEIWEKLEMMCEGTDQIKENKLMIAVQKFENFKMKPGETLEKFDSRFTEILNEMESLDKHYSQREKNLKVIRALPTEWDMKVVAMRESKDLSRISTFELFSDLKAFEFDIERRKDEETPSSKLTALIAPTAESCQAADSDTGGKDSKASKGNPINGYLCYNCRKPGHFIKDCPYPESKRYTDEEKAARAERKRKQEKERIRALLSEFEKTKETSPSSSKSPVESDSEDSIDSEDNEALICLMANIEEKNNEQLLEEVANNLEKLNEAEEKFTYLNISHEDLFTKASCWIADCIELKKENEALTKKLSETETRGKCWLRKLDWFGKSSRQLKEMLEQQRPAGDLSGIGYNPCDWMEYLYKAIPGITPTLTYVRELKQSNNVEEVYTFGKGKQAAVDCEKSTVRKFLKNLPEEKLEKILRNCREFLKLKDP